MIMKKWLEKIFLVAIVVIVAGCGSSDTPEGAYEKFNKAVMSDDWEGVSSALTKNSLSRTEGQLKSMAVRTEAYYKEKEGREDVMGSDVRKPIIILDLADMKALKPIMSLKGKEFFIKAAEVTKKVKAVLKKDDYELIDVKVREDSARMLIKHKGRGQESVMLVSEEGDWKVELNPSLFMRPSNLQQKKRPEKSKERSK